ncbi:LuxR family transcriptional regulator [Nocardioides endophyticus]|uniref:LuxR family transcriptional regulator n=1 Tax=Nocardioides endophyticus TaxID=1353775 RepID=A0ABP8Z120_9ACTN
MTGSVPAEVTALIGRKAEAADVKQMLARARVVTLTGPGGVGKTRLALRLAHSVRSAFADGIWMVPVAELEQADLLAATVLARLELDGLTGTRVEDLAGAIGDQQLLLVLDNCEHLTDAVAALVTHLLASCPELRVLTTSREALRVAGEALYVVPPLALPGPGALKPGEAQRFDSVALFVERARAIDPHFELGPDGERMVADLCQRLDGLPLAIELAASSTRWLSLDSLVERAGDPLDGPPSGLRSAPDRHQSLRASLGYSYDLCSPAARTLWARFSVFRGGADLEAVEAVCLTAGPDGVSDAIRPDPLRGSVPSALFELVDKSVVTREGDHYRMLETIRQFGAAHLAGDPADQAAVNLAHLRFFALRAERLSEGWFGPDQQALLTQSHADHANFRAALELSLEAPRWAALGVRVARELWAFWIGTGSPAEGRHWLGRLLALDGLAADERARALCVSGFLAAVDGDVAAARAHLDECLVVAAQVGDHATTAHAISTLGVAALFDGQLEDAVEKLTRGTLLERQIGENAPYLVDSLINLGLALSAADRLPEARLVLEEARTLCEASREQLLLSWTLIFLGLTHLREGRLPEAVSLARDGLSLKRSVGNNQGVTWAVEILASAAVRAGDGTRAATLLGYCDARATDFGPPFHGFPGMVTWHDEAVARAREAIGATAFAEAARRGAKFSLDELISLALDEAPAVSGTADGAPKQLPLTAREHEISTLVARGDTNREIAAQLVISPRTVDTHVQNVLTKLGFTSRSQIAALFASDRKGLARSQW